MIEELNPFTIDENTKPTFDSEAASWYLIKRGKHYAGWLWKSKHHKLSNGDYLRKYLITDLGGNKIVSDGNLLEDMLIKVDLFDKTGEERND